MLVALLNHTYDNVKVYDQILVTIISCYYYIDTSVLLEMYTTCKIHTKLYLERRWCAF